MIDPKDDFVYTLSSNLNDNQDEEYEKYLEKDIESNCDFSIYINKLELPSDYTDEELLTKSKEEIIQYKNIQIAKLKAYITSLEQEKKDLIDNFKETTNKLLDSIKENEYKYTGLRPETPMITKDMMKKKHGVTSKDFKSLSNNNTNNTNNNSTSSSSNKRQRCPNCTKDFSEEEFINHTLQCLRKNYYCNICQVCIDINKKNEHIQKFNDESNMIKAINERDEGLFKSMIMHGFDYLTCELNKENGWYTIHYLCNKNWVKMMKFLFEFDKGNKNNNNNNNNNEFKCMDDVINLTDKNKDTPLIICINNKASETALLLIKKGANVHLRNNSDLSPLMLGCKFNLIDIVFELIKYGADVNEKNILGETPLKIAQMYNHDDLAMMLLKKFSGGIQLKK